MSIRMILKFLGGSVQVYHIPIPNLEAPNLIVLHEVVDLISSCEKPVLIHCFSGCGKSGL
ncbi:MAG: hypothetical protein QW047_05130 [Sulfolobales archaeon]